MPSKSQPRNDFTMASGDTGLSSELKKRSTSKPVKERALSPRTSRKFREKAKAEYHIRPPHADLPFEFVKKGESGVVAQKRTEGKGESSEGKKPVKNGSKEGELVKHMSSLPGFLQQGEKPQDKILNFGVLDWERLEQWKHKQKQSSGRSRTAGESTACSSSSTSMKVSSVASGVVKTEVHASAKADPSPGALPDISTMSSSHDFGNAEKNCPDGQKGKIRRDKPRHRGHREKKSHKTKEPDSYQKESLGMEMSSSKLNSHNVSTSKENASDDRPDKKTEKQHHHRKQDSVVLLLPKDFSQSGRLDESQCPVLSRNSVELNWSSFSDVFSIEELRFEELSSDVSHSCPLPPMEDTETELDVNLDSLVRGQRMQLPSRQPTLSSFLNHRLSAPCEVEGEVTSSTASGNNSSHFTSSNGNDPSLARQLSPGIGRLTRSLSFKEGSGLPQLKRASIRSGPAEALNFRDNSTDEIFNGRSKFTPFRRLLDPILKPKTAKPNNVVDDSVPCLEDLKNPSIKDTNSKQVIQNGRSGSTTIKAVLQLSAKSGLPLFKFLVESSNEIFASTVKRLSKLEKNDPSWLYTFYSVQEVKRRKSSSWIHRRSKGKASDFSYNVIGQMKVSAPLPYGDEHDLEENFTRESVLYGVDVTKVDDASSKSAVNKELGAVVIEVPKEVSPDDQWRSVVVVLPGAAHSLPNEGVPASLIDRWRTGGVCDCGGWDVGCSLQVLTNRVEDDKISKSSNAYPFQNHCDLFLQGCGKQNKSNFTLAALGEGVYSIEYDAPISSLQAFATSVALLSDQKQASLSHPSIHSEERKGHYRSRSSVVHGEGARFATNPPHSPVGRA